MNFEHTFLKKTPEREKKQRLEFVPLFSLKLKLSVDYTVNVHWN